MKKILFLLIFSVSVVLPAFGDISVNRIAIATDIVDREPAGTSENFSGRLEKLYCFTEIYTDNFPTKVVHIWLYNDNIIAEVPLNINSGKWRTYSSKRILPSWTGKWKVEVYSEDGALIGSKSFTVNE